MSKRWPSVVKSVILVLHRTFPIHLAVSSCCDVTVDWLPVTLVRILLERLRSFSYRLLFLFQLFISWLFSFSSAFIFLFSLFKPTLPFFTLFRHLCVITFSLIYLLGLLIFLLFSLILIFALFPLLLSLSPVSSQISSSFFFFNSQHCHDFLSSSFVFIPFSFSRFFSALFSSSSTLFSSLFIRLTYFPTNFTFIHVWCT